LFVFTAYRDLETYLLNAVGNGVRRHLVQDGANFYFKISKPVFWSRLKETIKIYRNLWRHGIVLKKLVLYRKHMAQCEFIEQVWVTNPEIYQAPKVSTKPISKINLLTGKSIEACYRYFDMLEAQEYSNAIIYLSSRYTDENAVLLEIAQLKYILDRLKKPRLIIKLHPNAPIIQVNLFRIAFADSVIKNFVPAELYISKAIGTYVIGVASAALYYNNPRCSYYSLVKIFQSIGVFPTSIEVSFPVHVEVLASINDLGINLHPG
jgi:hypothetical protein